MSDQRVADGLTQYEGPRQLDRAAVAAVAIAVDAVEAAVLSVRVDVRGAVVAVGPA